MLYKYLRLSKTVLFMRGRNIYRENAQLSMMMQGPSGAGTEVDVIRLEVTPRGIMKWDNDRVGRHKTEIKCIRLINTISHGF